MRRLILFITCALVAATGCNKPQRVSSDTTAASEPGLRSIVHVADESCSQQLLHGFHALEANAWRWTKGRFGVKLRPPRNANKDGAYLIVKLSVAESVIQHLGSVQLSANVNGTALEAETYATNGDYIYRRDVPASALQSDAVTVEFTLDKSIEAGKVDPRELGIIVAMVGFESKGI